MTAVLGVDGGQSAIRLRHSEEDRVIEVPGVSHLEGDGIGMVADAIDRGWREAGFAPVERVVLGLTTAPAEPADADRLCALVGSATDAVEVWLADDAVTAHAGALSLGWGVALAAGTGVACLAVRPDRSARIVGGHGFLLGDEGGAFWIGREGLRAVLRAAEERAVATDLAEGAADRFGDVTDLHVRLHTTPRPVDAIAQFAPDVLAAADGGDPVASAIVDAAAVALLSVAVAAASWVAPGGGPVPLALGGRLLGAGSALRRRLDVQIAVASHRFDARSADASPLDGAIALGRSGRHDAYPGLIHRWTRGAAA